MARPVRYVIVGVGFVSHQLQDEPHDLLVAALVTRPDQVRPADRAPGQDQVDGGVVVVDVGPLAHVLAGPVQLRPQAAQDVGDLARYELLDVLVGAVVIGAVGDRGGDPVRPRPRPDQHVRAGLGGRVRARRVVRGALGELLGRVKRQVAEHLVGRDVVEPAAVPADRLKQRERPDRCCVRTNGSGSRSELSTCDSAAKCTITSVSAARRSTVAASQISPCTNSTSAATSRKRRSVGCVGQRVEHAYLVLAGDA